MASPALNEKTFSPEHVTQLWNGGGGDSAGFARGYGGTGEVPAVSRTDVMTVDGTIAKSLFLLAFLVAGATFGWNAVSVVNNRINLPGWAFVALFGALGIAIVTIMKPKIARFTAPAYAVEGLVVGAISAAYNIQYKGIVLQAVVSTLGLFAVMLFLYTSGRVRVTPKMQRGVGIAMIAILAVYGVSLLASAFGAKVSYMSDASPLGFLISFVVIGVACFMLLIDFDRIQQGVTAGAPKYMEWYCAFSLLITLVWLYLEVLRLLSRIQQR
jgi:uncharacterized YccA/Bax inhibitor family protein